MSNYILQNLHRLKRRHYVLLANQAEHWFNASPTVMKKYIAQYVDDFCLILYRNDPNDDAFIMPFGLIKSVFTEENLAVASTSPVGRWHGSVKVDYLSIRGADDLILVAQCYNAIDLLEN